MPVSTDERWLDVRTQGLAALGHPELRLCADGQRVSGEALRWLASALSEPVLGGGAWSAGEGVRIGWGTLRMAVAGEELVVEEWDPRSQGFVAGVTFTLVALGVMNDLLERAGLLDLARYPHAEDFAAVALAPGDDQVEGMRDMPGDGDSGWRLAGALDAEAEPQPLWQVVDRLPALLPVLAVPPGSAVRLEQGRITSLVPPDGTERVDPQWIRGKPVP